MCSAYLPARNKRFRQLASSHMVLDVYTFCIIILSQYVKVVHTLYQNRKHSFYRGRMPGRQMPGNSGVRSQARRITKLFPSDLLSITFMTTTAAPDIAEEYYPIRTVSTLTGVNAITLRAWERRYGLIKPRRTPKGHRLYTTRDIELINRIVTLLDKGVSISQVPEALRHQKSTVVTTAESAGETDTWKRYRERMIDAVIRFDESALEAAYNEVLSLYPIDIVTHHLLIPVLRELGERWVSAEGSISEEHFFGTYMRNKLGARFHHRNLSNRGPRLLACCLPGENHEIGLLLFALAAHDNGFRITLLGANMPLVDLPATLKRAHCDALVLSASIEPPDQLLATDLPKLVRTAKCPVFIGGITSARHHDDITKAGAISLGNDIRKGVSLIEVTLNSLT